MKLRKPLKKGAMRWLQVQNKNQGDAILIAFGTVGFIKGPEIEK